MLSIFALLTVGTAAGAFLFSDFDISSGNDDEEDVGGTSDDEVPTLSSVTMSDLNSLLEESPDISVLHDQSSHLKELETLGDMFAAQDGEVVDQDSGPEGSQSTSAPASHDDYDHSEQGPTIKVVQEDVFAGDGDDYITYRPLSPVGDPFIQELHGGGGDDTIISDQGLVEIFGDEGDDKITSGRDALAFGGDGEDEIIVSGRNVSVDGGQGDDQIRAKVVIQPQESFPLDENGAGFFRFEDNGMSLTGGDGEDVFIIEATLNNVQDTQSGVPIITTIEDYNPEEDFVLVRLDGTEETEGRFTHWLQTGFQDLPHSEQPEINGPTTQHALEFDRVETDSNGEYTDVILRGEGYEGSTKVSQEFAIRFNGASEEDVRDITIAPTGFQ